MKEQRFQLSEEARLRVQALEDTGTRWANNLSRNVSRLESEWKISVADSLKGGSESLVLSAERDDGTPVILKLALPGSENLKNEAQVLRFANGHGYAKLFAYDESCNGLLMERLGEPVALAGLSVQAQFEQICSTLQTAWIPIDETLGLMTGLQKARWLANFISKTWLQMGKPCSQATIDLALAYASEREKAFDPATCVLVHGDAHEFNTLFRIDQVSGDESSCKFIDPDGLFAEPAYDLGVLMRGENEELLASDALRLGRNRCEFLSEQTGIDEKSIWQWGFIERVSTGLHCMQIGMFSLARDTLAIAEYWSRRHA